MPAHFSAIKLREIIELSAGLGKQGFLGGELSVRVPAGSDSCFDDCPQLLGVCADLFAARLGRVPSLRGLALALLRGPELLARYAKLRQQRNGRRKGRQFMVGFAGLRQITGWVSRHAGNVAANRLKLMFVPLELLEFFEHRS